MTWEEYKAQRRKEEKNVQTVSINSNSSSSWEEYKEQRKREKQKEQKKEVAPKTNTTESTKIVSNLTEADLRKIEQNTGIKTGTLNLTQVQQHQNKFNELQEKGKSILNDKSAKTITEKQKKNIDTKKDVKIIVSNLKDSAYSGTLQFGKTVGMSTDNAYNTQVDMRRILQENMINERKKRGLSTEELEEDLENNPIYQKSDVKPFYQEKIDKVNQRMAENTEQASNPVSKKVAELSQSMGNNIAGMAITAINPALGFAYFTGSATGSYYDEAIQKGMNDNDARNYATIMGLMEGTTEKYLSAQNIKGAKAILEGTGIKNALKSFGLEVGENFVQEAVMPAISELTTKAIAGDEYLKYDYNTAEGWKTLGMDSLSDGIDGALSAILLNGATKGVASCINITNKMKNGNKVSEQEIKVALTDAQKSGVDAEKILKDKIQESAIKKIITTKNETPELAQNVQNSTEQQTILNDIKTLQNENTAQLDDMLNNKELPMKNYIYEKSNNAKIDNLRKDASRYFNNLEKTHNYMQMLEKIIEDKNIDIRFNADLKTPDGKIANGSYSNGVITINPNSTRTGEFIAIHELTHAIGTDSMKNIIETYRKSNPEFNTAVEKLLQNYNSTEITEEALSDVSAQLFGNQEFINNIAQTNPNIFQKIYSEIKYLWHQFRGYKNQNQFIEDLYYKWTQAYNSNNKLNNSENYLITQNNKGKYVKADRQVITGNNPLEWETQVENYINDNIRQGKDVQVTTENGDILTITKDTSGKAKFRNQITDKYGNTRYLNNKEFLSKLTAETHIDELAQISQKINKNPIPDYKKHKFAKDGFDYRSAYFEDFDGQYYKITMSVGKNGNIDTIYNIGKMDKKNRSKSSLVAQRPSDKNITSNEELTSTNSIPSSNKDVNTTTKYSTQESENNSGSFSMQDNQGRTLTKEQQEFFKDVSKEMLDKNGNVKTLYTGSNSEFTIFDREKSGQSNKSARVGFWFTETAEGAKNFANSTWYGDNKPTVYEVYLNLKNPKVYDTIDTTAEVNQKRQEINNKKREQRNITEKYEYSKMPIERVLPMLTYGYAVEQTLEDTGYNQTKIEEYKKDINQYKQLREEVQKLENQLKNMGYDDSYEQFRTDIYAMAGKSAEEANVGGLGMMLQNEREVVEEYRQKLIDEGYDGIIIKNTRFDSDTMGGKNTQYVAFYPEQIKNVDNTNPTDNPDIKYSQNNGTWQSYLDKNFKPTGTRTNMQDILVSKATNEGAFTQQAKNDTQNNQKVAPSTQNNVLETGEWAKRQKNQTKKYTRKEVRNRLFQEMQISPEELSIGDDIKAINYQLTDPVRVNEKVFGKELGDKINNATINKTKHNTAEKIRWQNKERQEIQDLGIKARSKESAAVQKYGEKQWVDNNGNIHKYGDTELATEFPDIETQNKIKNAAQVIRNKYDLYIDQINDTLTELGYDAIPKRKDYMRHFQELGDVFSQTGVPFNLNDLSAEDLPTDINGLTEFNKPGKNWFASSQKRYGNKTTYDAITGIDGYLEGAGNLIFHTEDVQNYRALSEAVRNQFGQTKGFENLEGLTDEQIKQRIEDIQSNKLSKYVAWLDEQANALAGKKGAIDRGVERAIGRRGYTVLNTLKKQVGSNMTGFNVRSSLTNFISSTIASAKTNKIALAKGTISTINNMFHNDGFIEKSDFLTSRFGSNSLSAKTWQKISNAGQIFMTGSDYFTSNLIARSKYYEGLQKGMTEQEALRYSNDFSSRVMGDRSQGATPEAFNSKTLGLFTQFQLEVNNQWQYMIHDTKMDYQQNMKKNGGLKAGATALFQMGQLAAYSYFFNELFEKVTGSRAAFDPIEIFKVLFGIDDDDDDKTFDEKIAEAGEMLVDNLPFGNLITGGGRIPISEAFEGIGTLGKKLTNQKNQYGGDISWKDVGSDILTSLPYWISPTGYSQAKKTTQGISTMIKGGDYKTNSEGEKELRFPVENKSASTYLKAGLFGKYSLPTSKEYINNDFKRLSAKQTKAYEESNISYTEYVKYLNQKLSKNEDKINYIENTKWSTEQKWGIYVNDILSDTERKDGGSQVTDAKYIIKNGISKFDYINCYNKAQKNNIDMPTKEEYMEMKESGLSLKTYMNYSVKVKEETEKQRKAGTIKEDGSIKDKDKIQIILDSTYTSTERTALYENYVLDSDDKKYPIIKRTFTDNGLNITKYLEYKKQEFEGDKVDNGTVKGKTISGNKKKKVWDYIDNMKITGNQKLILWALEYEPSYNYQKQQVVNYVKSLKGVTEKEKLDMMSSFKGVTVYKDGRIFY